MLGLVLLMNIISVSEERFVGQNNTFSMMALQESVLTSPGRPDEMLHLINLSAMPNVL